MKSSPESTTATNEWLGTSLGCGSVAAGFALLVASNYLDVNAVPLVQFVGLVGCMLGARQVLRKANGWIRIPLSGIVCGLAHGLWAFLFTLFPPPTDAPNYFSGVEGAILMFLMWSIFTGAVATFVSMVVEIVSMLLSGISSAGGRE